MQVQSCMSRLWDQFGNMFHNEYVWYMVDNCSLPKVTSKNISGKSMEKKPIIITEEEKYKIYIEDLKVCTAVSTWDTWFSKSAACNTIWAHICSQRENVALKWDHTGWLSSSIQISIPWKLHSVNIVPVMHFYTLGVHFVHSFTLMKHRMHIIDTYSPCF